MPVRRGTWILACLALAACGGNDTERTFDAADAPVTFTYPSAYVRVFTAAERQIKGRPPTFSVAYGLDDTNVVVVSTYRLKRSADDYTPERFREFVDTAVRAIARASDQKVAKRERGRLADLDAYTYDLDGQDVDARLILSFKGVDQYFVRCQWDDDHGDDVRAACATVERSLRVR